MSLFGEGTEVDKLANEVYDCCRYPYSRDRTVTAYEALQALAKVAEFIAENYDSQDEVT